MKTKLIIFLINIFFINVICSNGQNNIGKLDDFNRITLTPIIADQHEYVPDAAYSLLQNKLQQIVTNNGLGTSSHSSRFVITCNLNVITKDIVPGPPAMISMNLDATYYVIDYVSKTVFSSTSLGLKAIGTNSDKAYISAIKSINASSTQFKSFIELGKNKIIAYYNDRCDYIIQEAQLLASQKSFQEAIFKLSSIPEVCKECYMKATNIIGPLFQAYIDDLCTRNLAAAKAVWIGNQNSYGAAEVSGFLSEILPDAKCYEEAQILVNEIRKKVLSDENREWDFQLKRWNDTTNLESQKIRAYRDVGVAYGNNQPNNTYHFRGWLW